MKIVKGMSVKINARMDILAEAGSAGKVITNVKGESVPSVNNSFL